jgi:hypothetical protein
MRTMMKKIQSINHLTPAPLHPQTHFREQGRTHFVVANYRDVRREPANCREAHLWLELEADY